MQTFKGSLTHVRRPAWTLIFLGALAFLALSGRTQVDSATFAGTTDARYCNALSGSFPDAQLAGSPACGDPSPIATSTAYPLTTTFDLPAGNSIASEPTYTLLSPDTTVAADASIPNGEKVAGLEYTTNYGLFNGACFSLITMQTVLYDSATSGTPVAPAAEGTSNRFASLVTDANSDGRADANSAFVTSNLTIYETLLDPDGTPGTPPVSPIVPRARYSGATQVGGFGGEWQLFSVFVFDPGSLAPFNTDATNRPHPLGRVGRTTGNSLVMVSVLGDPSAAITSSSPITDICAPQNIRAMFLGTTPNSHGRSSTPATAGTRVIGQYAMGLRDDDNDGLENQLDTCPFSTNLGSDTDSDGIDNACDPGAPGGIDQDGDGISNRGDNCPLIVNGGAAQAESEITTGYVTAASDGGPRTDGIGNACDPNPTTSINEGLFASDYNFVPKCIGGAPDIDGDGYCFAQDIDDGDALVRGYSLNRGSDQDGNTLTGDNFGANVENYVGTDPTRGCGFTPGAPGQSETWPADVVEGNSINISDYLAFLPIMGQSVPTASARFDLMPSKRIDIRDPLTFRSFFGTTCTSTITPAPSPVDGTMGTIAIDADIAGNDPRLTLGANIQPCISLPSIGSTAQVDVVMPSPGIGATDGLAGWHLDLNYNPAVLKVTAQDIVQLIDQAASSNQLNYSASLPDTDGSFRSAALELTSPATPEPAGRDEVGPGVLTRITIEAVGTGLSTLSLENLVIANSTNGLIAPFAIDDGYVRVGSACFDPLSPGGISGTKWDDINGNGARDGEPTLEGVQICLSSIVPPSVTGPTLGCTFTDANGDYEFLYLPAGWYRVEEPPPSGMTQTYPNGGQPHFVEVFNAVVTGSDFGNIAIPPGGISGVKFQDTDQNGVQNGGELGTPGITICIIPSQRCTTTGAGGAYSFDNVATGLVTVSEVLPNNTLNTTPLNQQVTVNSNAVAAGVDFGNVGPVAPPPEVNVGGAYSYSGIPVVYSTTTITKDVTDHCEPGNNMPVAVKLVVTYIYGPPSSHMMVDLDGVGSGEVWSAAVAFTSGGLGTLTFYVDCPPDTPGFPEDIGLIAGEDEIQQGGNIYIDPSGEILDVCNSNAPMAGVTVTLLKESPPNSGNYIAPVTTDHIPAVNPQVTGSDGHYGWTVVAGNYKVRAVKAGYITQDSAVVTIPPAVTDLDIGLVCDTDGDGVGDPSDPCPSYASFWTVPPGDVDCDGFTTAAETTIGTATGDPCGFTAGAPAQSETWPPDLVESNGINISDVLALKPHFGPGAPPRFDVVPNGGNVNISDVLALKPFFGKSCTP